jgi:serine/threonine protein kinase
MPDLLQHEKFQSAPGSRVGTPAYLAPEVIMTTKGQTYDGKVCRAALQHLRRAVAL